MDVVVMPQLGETVVEGTIVSWTKVVGDEVSVDDTLFEVSTEKVDTEVPSAVAGYFRAALVPEGDTVAIGTPVAVITATADEPFEPPSTTATLARSVADAVEIQAGLAEPAPAPGEIAPRADLVGDVDTSPPHPPDHAVWSPAVRRLLA